MAGSDGHNTVRVGGSLCCMGETACLFLQMRELICSAAHLSSYHGGDVAGHNDAPWSAAFPEDPLGAGEEIGIRPRANPAHCFPLVKCACAPHLCAFWCAAC